MQLYSKELMQQAKDERGAGVLDNPTHENLESNPICGDRVRWTLNISDEHIIEARHYTRGCVLCKASASLLFGQLQGKAVSEILDTISVFHSGIEKIAQGEEFQMEAELFSGLKYAPLRISCVLLPWEGLAKALITIPNGYTSP